MARNYKRSWAWGGMMAFTLSDRRRGARMYAPDEGRWKGVDIQADSFLTWSPYNYVYNNPVRFIDPDGNSPEDGDDIVVLLNKESVGGLGHTTILIGDDKNGWVRINKGGRRIDPETGEQDGTLLFGGRSEVTITEYGQGVTLDDILAGDDLSAYDKGLRFKTTPEQDQAAIKASTEAAERDYHVLIDNCADACSAGLEAAGINGGSERHAYNQGPTVADKSYSPVPATRFRQMKKNNPEAEEFETPRGN